MCRTALHCTAPHRIEARRGDAKGLRRGIQSLGFTSRYVDSDSDVIAEPSLA